jgi:hypothetical protein
MKAEMEKRFSKGFLSISYERNVLFSDNFIHLTLNYDLSFARTNISASHSRDLVMISENAQGSVEFGGGNRYVHASYNSSAGKGGISIYPFLDLNRNGTFDQGEKLVKISSVRVNGGKPLSRSRDSIIRIPDLNSFLTYTVEFADKDLENISWRFKNKTYSIRIDPNQFKRVDVPVEVVGEVTGMAWLDKENERKGLGRIRVKFYRKNGMEVIGETISEPDGYLEYMGLTAGDYVACVDTAQLRNLNYTVDPLCRPFTVKTTEQGDIVSGLDFILRPVLKSKIIDNKNVK